MTLRKICPSSLTRSQHTNKKTKTTFGICLKLKSTGYPPYICQQDKSKELIYHGSHTIIKIIKLIRKRYQLYTHLKRSCTHKSLYTEKFKHLKSTVIQKQIRKCILVIHIISYLFWHTRSWSQEKVLQLCLTEQNRTAGLLT